MEPPIRSNRTVNEKLARILPLLFLLYVAALYGATAVMQDGLFERDGYYHARFAEMMPDRGLDREFQWTQLSTWRERFCDKEFLYHLAMMPFAQIGDEPIFGAKLFAVLLSVTVMAGLYLVLRAHAAPWPVFFTALPFAAGGLFIARLGMIRSHVLSMALLMLGMHLLLKGKWRTLFLLGFIYAWSYTMPFILLMTAIPFVAGVWIKGEGLNWKLPAAAGIASALGLAIHPYSPETLESFLTYLQVFSIGMQGKGTSGFELGNEIYPYALPVFSNIYPLVVVLVPALIIFAVWQWKQLTASAVGVLFSTLFWVAMTAASARFVEYSVLLLTLAYALALRDTRKVDFGLGKIFSLKKDIRLILGITAVVILLGLHLRSMTFYTYYQTQAAPPRRFTGTSHWMEKNLKPGETVINLFWDDFPELYYDGARQTYLWGLDPTYSIREDKEKAGLLEQFRSHKLLLDGKRMAEIFQSRVLVLRTRREAGFPELAFPPFHKVYGDTSGVVYVIK